MRELEKKIAEAVDAIVALPPDYKWIIARAALRAIEGAGYEIRYVGPLTEEEQAIRALLDDKLANDIEHIRRHFRGDDKKAAVIVNRGRGQMIDDPSPQD